MSNPPIALSLLESGLRATTRIEAEKLWVKRLRDPNLEVPDTLRDLNLEVPDIDQSDSEERAKAPGDDVWDYLKHATISQDQTAESDYAQQQLAALKERVISLSHHDSGLVPGADHNFELTLRGLVSQSGGPKESRPSKPEEKQPKPARTAEVIAGGFQRWAEDIIAVLDDHVYEGYGQRQKRFSPPGSENTSVLSVIDDEEWGSSGENDESAGVADTVPAWLEVGEHRADGTGSEPLKIAEATPEPPSPPPLYHPPIPTMGSESETFTDVGGAMSPRSDLKGLLQQIEALRAENRRLKGATTESEKTVTFEAPAPAWQTFHRLDGNTSVLGPSWVVSDTGSKSLRIDIPLANPPRYLERHPEIAFAVYKDYQRDVQPNAKDDWPEDEEMGAPEPQKESVKFTSDAMVGAIKAFVKEQPDFNKQFPKFDPTEEIPAPYRFWYYCRSLYAEALGRLRPEQQSLVELFSQWNEINYGQEYRDAESRFADGFVSHKSIKYLIRAGITIVSYLDDQLHAFESTSWPKLVSEPVTSGPESEGKKPPERRYVYTITGWSWCLYDDGFYAKERVLEIVLSIPENEEEVPIVSLDVFPLRYASQEVQETLRQRGETYWKCRNQRLVDYHDGGRAGIREEPERYMIDTSTYKKLHKEGILRQPRRGAADRTISESVGPQGSEIYLFPKTIKGYNLRRKKWVDLDVDNIRNVNWNKEAFDSLVVNKDTKELIQALVMTRLQAEKGADLISGKGNGLIMLLHGGPGTGKTFTAETVAELAEKPLYRVTCGDIGTKPEDVESYLESVLHLGKIWGCVVLLDEADVFLEERSLSDLERNALVSVFLRVLEYYDGILILTSNRVGTFDDAFKSRIQLALRYEKLKTPQRRRIWWNFLQHFKRMKDTGIDFDDLDDHIEELAEHDMNGRQIRNAITTARQLAQHRKKIMDFGDLKHVINVSGRFENYLRGVKEGATDEEINRSNRVR